MKKIQKLKIYTPAEVLQKTNLLYKKREHYIGQEIRNQYSRKLFLQKAQIEIYDIIDSLDIESFDFYNDSTERFNNKLKEFADIIAYNYFFTDPFKFVQQFLKPLETAFSIEDMTIFEKLDSRIEKYINVRVFLFDQIIHSYLVQEYKEQVEFFKNSLIDHFKFYKNHIYCQLSSEKYLYLSNFHDLFNEIKPENEILCKKIFGDSFNEKEANFISIYKAQKREQYEKFERSRSC